MPKQGDQQDHHHRHAHAGEGHGASLLNASHCYPQDPTEMARLERGDRFVDPSVNAFHGEVSVNEDRFGTRAWYLRAVFLELPWDGLAVLLGLHDASFDDCVARPLVGSKQEDFT